MNFLEKIGCKHYQYLLSITGACPYQNPRWRLFIRSIVGSIATLAVLSKILYVLRKKPTLQEYVRISADLFYVALCTAMLFDSYIKMDKVRLLLNEINMDLESLKVEKEIKIMQDHYKSAKSINTVCFIYVCLMDACIILVTYTSEIINTVSSVNESETHENFYHADFLVDEEKYFHVIMLFMHIDELIIDFTLVGNQMMFVLCMEHLCGTFAVLRYRLEHTLPVLEVCLSRCKNVLLHREITTCIDIHQKVTELAYQVESAFGIFISLILTGCTVMGGFDLVHVLTVSTAQKEEFVYVFYICMQLTLDFIISYVGQELIDKSTNIAKSAYNLQWYKLSNDDQKLLKLFIMRSERPCTISVCKLYIVSLKSFGSYIQAIVSYSMVIREL